MTLYPLINVAPARCQTPATVNGHIDLMIACWRWLMLWSHRNAFRSPAEKVTVPAGGHHLGNSATDCSSQLPCVVKILNYLLAKNVLCHMFVVVPSKDVKKMLDFSLKILMHI